VSAEVFVLLRLFCPGAGEVSWWWLALFVASDWAFWTATRAVIARHAAVQAQASKELTEQLVHMKWRQ
jgi:hypothetical protein